MSAHPTPDSLPGPSCTHCADWSAGYALGYSHGLAKGYADAAGDGPAHPAVADSVARMFGTWDGPDAARARSVTRFQTWHSAQRERGAA